MFDRFKKRKVNPNFDIKPSVHQIFNYKISKPFIKNKTVLDIGCWSGQYEAMAQKDAKKLVGIDPESEAIKFAKKQNKKVDFYIGHALKLNFPKRSFDTVVFLEVIEHIPKNTELQALKEIKRVLKPKGYLVLSTPHSHPISILLDPAFFLLGHRHYSYSHLFQLLNQSGFKIKKVFYTAGLIRLIALNLHTFWKIIFKRPFVEPAWMQKIINDEYESGGFGQIHLIAQVK